MAVTGETENVDRHCTVDEHAARCATIAGLRGGSSGQPPGIPNHGAKRHHGVLSSSSRDDRCDIGERTRRWPAGAGLPRHGTRSPDLRSTGSHTARANRRIELPPFRTDVSGCTACSDSAVTGRCHSGCIGARMLAMRTPNRGLEFVAGRPEASRGDSARTCGSRRSCTVCRGRNQQSRRKQARLLSQVRNRVCSRWL